MAFSDFMNKVRYWDNMMAKWIIRHFYMLFFQVVLVIIFIVWFINTLAVFDYSFQSEKLSISDKINTTQTAFMSIVVLLILFNSFWTLYIFNSIIRMKTILRDVNYNLSKMRNKRDYTSNSKKED